MKLKPTLAALGLALLLAACGDSPQDVAAPAPPTPQATGDVPAGALSTPTAFSQFAASLVKTETGQPLNINGAVPPTSETAAPIPVL